MYRLYSQLKQVIKKLIPTWIFTRLVNYFHWAETGVAMVVNGWPARGMRIVGITGTNGKTTSAIMTAQILEHAGLAVGLNSTAQVGWLGDYHDNEFAMTTANPFQLHKLLRQMKKAGVELVVMEVASHALVQHRVSGLDIEVAAITNLTPDHFDYHGTMENYAAAKGKLFARSPAHSVLNADDEWFDFFADFVSQDQVTYGITQDATLQLTGAKLRSDGAKIEVLIDGQAVDTTVNLPGKFNVYNALTAMSIGYSLGLTRQEVVEGMAQVDGIPGRMELVDEGQEFTVLVDYAHTTDALENVLQTIRQTLSGRLIVVIGGDGGRDPQRLAPFGKAAADNAELVIVADQEPYPDDPDQLRRQVLEGANSSDSAVVVKEQADRKQAITDAFTFAKKGDVVLIAGLGHQKTRYMNDGKIDWDDRQVARELLITK